MTEHQLLLVLIEVLVIVVVARTGGEIALRLGIPQVVGELVAGICLGPSLFGALWPGGFEALFPNDRLQRDLLEIIGWFGIMFLVLVAGLETRLGVLRRSGRAVATGWVGGFFIPFGMGFVLGWLLPSSLHGLSVTRPVFALFVATAMSISAIPVISRILLDLGLFHSRMGMVILTTALADDTVGWIMLTIVAGLATSQSVDVPAVAVALGGTAVFLAFAFTLGQFLVRKAIQLSWKLRMPYAQASIVLALIFAGGAITQALRVHLVLGVLVVGVLIARSHGKKAADLDAIKGVGMAFLVPFFFGYTGLKVDLAGLDSSMVWAAVVCIVVACVSKLVGGSLGAAAGGLSRWEALAVGVGLNVRGAMELVIAAIGLSLGVVNVPMYSIIVLVAVVTTLMAAPLLRACLNRFQEESSEHEDLTMEIAS